MFFQKLALLSSYVEKFRFTLSADQTRIQAVQQVIYLAIIPTSSVVGINLLREGLMPRWYGTASKAGVTIKVSIVAKLRPETIALAS